MRKYSVRYLGCIPQKCSVRVLSVLRATMCECLKTQESGLKPKSFTVGCHHHAADGRTAYSHYDVFMFIINPSSIIQSLDVHTAARPCLRKCQVCLTQIGSELCSSMNVLLISRELQLVQVVHNFPQDARVITLCNSTVQVLCLQREHKLIEQHYY